MPNWCWNNTIVYGEKEMLEKFYNDMVIGTSTNPNFKPVENSWDNEWLGNLFLAAGYTEEEVTNGTIRCRGGIYEIYWLDSGTAVGISYETAWEPIIDSFNKMLIEKYKGLNQVTLAEECGCGLYVNTDVSGEFFPDKYYFDYCVNNEYSDNHYYESEEDLVEHFNELFGSNAETYEDLQKIIPDLYEKYEDDDEFFITLNAFGGWC